MEWQIIGILAALLTTFGFIPQIIKMIRKKSVKDISIITLFQFSAGVLLWTIYGMYLGDLIIITANIITFITLVMAIVFYHHYNRKQNRFIDQEYESFEKKF
jgi:MtN3 and saliva related transmembrane protein